MPGRTHQTQEIENAGSSIELNRGINRKKCRDVGGDGLVLMKTH